MAEGVHQALKALAVFDGETWQERWQASGSNSGSTPLLDAVEDKSAAYYSLNAGLGRLFAMRVVQPSLAAFRSYRFNKYAASFEQVSDDPQLHEYFRRLQDPTIPPSRRNLARSDLAVALTVFGIDIAEMTPEALLHYSVASRQLGASRGSRGRDGCYAAIGVWPVLYEMGIFPASAPKTLRAAVVKGQRSIPELVDRYPIRNAAVRELLINYIQRRAVSLDYSSVNGLTVSLAKHFWQAIEAISPDQEDLRLDEATVTEWKRRAATRPDGTPRKDLERELLSVRALYLDLQSWAVAEPARWGHWAVPCPIRDADLRWAKVLRKRVKERMDGRTRELQPILPLLVDHVTERWHWHRELLKAASARGRGEEFELHGRTWKRLISARNATWYQSRHAPVRVQNCLTGEIIAITNQENLAFWRWALIETLRLSGVRCEELVELTHLSVRNYRRPNGEVVALLVISPSKTDRERVVPMSAELFHVIAQVIRRHIDQHGTVPVCARYDLLEKVWSPELPYLFQGGHVGSRRALSATTINRTINKAVADLAKTQPKLEGITFSPHDFRRLFATEVVNSGLPIHIGAKLLGHMNIQTTRGYVAVFDEDVVTHYQQFLDRRRELRPQDEYRDPTTEEWADFQEHFDKRRVELGSCGRPYGTPCAHEHACVRCPMLSIDPKMLPRLDELEDDLLDRRRRAVEEHWRGEIEGIDLTLTFLRSKRHQARRAINLGLPTIRQSRKGADGR
ncbi:tyrosine-type recombinase/integrase [Glycomyces harbinensis]|uniref:Phage integrase family protein n=1 Tax=Glycomyces harbinensis TaxID=58114 RepID=A0A1G6VKW2_9ACTN|nr:site-specific integrase [Glycomyces harbinensis]SDD54260.1 Phage integrase family protein [Glycomyces harbinensis]